MRRVEAMNRSNFPSAGSESIKQMKKNILMSGERVERERGSFIKRVWHNKSAPEPLSVSRSGGGNGESNVIARDKENVTLCRPAMCRCSKQTSPGPTFGNPFFCFRRRRARVCVRHRPTDSKIEMYFSYFINYIETHLHMDFSVLDMRLCVLFME